MGPGAALNFVADNSNHQCNAPPVYTSKLASFIKIHTGTMNICLTFLSDESANYVLIAGHQLSSTSYENDDISTMKPFDSSGDGHP